MDKKKEDNLILRYDQGEKSDGTILRSDRDSAVAPSVAIEQKISVPNIYMWEDEQAGTMTVAFRMFGGNYGFSFRMNEEKIKRDSDLKKLQQLAKESLDVLIHHGRKILDSKGDIDPVKINYEEALRNKYDPIWFKRVKAFNQVVRFKNITGEEAKKLKLI